MKFKCHPRDFVQEVIIYGVYNSSIQFKEDKKKKQKYYNNYYVRKETDLIIIYNVTTSVIFKFNLIQKNLLINVVTFANLKKKNGFTFIVFFSLKWFVLIQNP